MIEVLAPVTTVEATNGKARKFEIAVPDRIEEVADEEEGENALAKGVHAVPPQVNVKKQKKKGADLPEVLDTNLMNENEE